jgi:hypothetical protein
MGLFGYRQDIGPADRNADVGDCLRDRRQIGNITTVNETPRFPNPAARLIGSGWAVGSTVVARFGAPLTIVTGTTPDLARGYGGNSPGTQRPNLMMANTASATRGHACGNSAFCKSWFNPAAFAAPAIGAFGSLGYHSVRGPGFWEWDMALSREVQNREGQKLEVRVEAFNVTNSLRLGNPGTTLNSGNTFGVITSDATAPAGVSGGSSTNVPARVMQFALKYVF